MVVPAPRRPGPARSTVTVTSVFVGGSRYASVPFRTSSRPSRAARAPSVPAAALPVPALAPCGEPLGPAPRDLALGLDLDHLLFDRRGPRRRHLELDLRARRVVLVPDDATIEPDPSEGRGAGRTGPRARRGRGPVALAAVAPLQEHGR